jgi:Ca2+-binding EF-hand superfamily protein
MKLIKIILAIVMALAMVVAQDTGDHEGGDGQDGGPPFEAVDTNGDGVVDRDEARAMFGQDEEGNPDPEFDAEYDKIDANGDGVVDHAEYMAADDGGGDHDGGDGHDGPPPFEDVDTNGDGLIDRDEARAMFGQDEEGNPDPEFDAEYDRIAGDDGMVDHAEYMAADDGGGGTCDECGHEYGGSDDHHGHCRVCGAEMNTDDDWRAHCDENGEHCKPQAGDVCPDCNYEYTGAEGEEHGHCNYENENGDRCGDENNTAAEWEEHRNEYPDHFPDDGGGDHDGGPRFEDVDANGDGLIDRDEARAMFGHDEEGNPDPEFDAEYDRIAGDDGMVDHDEFMAAGDGGPPTNHWDGNCGAMKHGESEYWLDSDGDPNNGAEDGPYAVWYEDADGNPVDCQPPPNDGNQN